MPIITLHARYLLGGDPPEITKCRSTVELVDLRTSTAPYSLFGIFKFKKYLSNAFRTTNYLRDIENNETTIIKAGIDNKETINSLSNKFEPFTFRYMLNQIRTGNQKD